MFYIDTQTNLQDLTQYLQKKGWLHAAEIITDTAIPGAGNMNVVVRLTTNQRTLILKQSRPFVQKYPQLAAPLNRIDVEYQFYTAMQAAAQQLEKSPFPKLLQYDADEHLMLLEDLGHGKDMSSIYAARHISEQQTKQLVRFLETIHQVVPPKGYPINEGLRQLNHQHIFVLPFLADNGFDLDNVQQGLQALAQAYKQDNALTTIATQLGEAYLSAGTTLLHGDYYPGSWMQQQEALCIIDPEFSFVGDAYYDVGVFVAHLIIATGNINKLDWVLDNYSLPIDKKKVQQLAGIEIMRRLIGLGQLPLEHTLAEKKELLELAKELILSSDSQ